MSRAKPGEARAYRVRVEFDALVYATSAETARVIGHQHVESLGCVNYGKPAYVGPPARWHEYDGRAGKYLAAYVGPQVPEVPDEVLAAVEATLPPKSKEVPNRHRLGNESETYRTVDPYICGAWTSGGECGTWASHAYRGVPLCKRHVRHFLEHGHIQTGPTPDDRLRMPGG